MLARTCQYCGVTNNRVFKYKGKWLVCDRHFQQIKFKGKIGRTKYDKNEIFNRGKYYELALYKKGKIVAFSKFDKPDLNLVKKYKWYLSSTGHIATKSKNGVNFLHRLLMNCPKGMEVDHKFGDSLDNRKSKLRVATHSENLKNQKPRSGRKFKGTSYNGYGWIAQLTFNYKNFYLGSYATQEEAARVYDRKAKELFGKFARLNFPHQTSS